MKVFASGSDQFNLLSSSKRHNRFSLLNVCDPFEFEECVLDWDFILYQSSSNWFIKGLNWRTPIQIFSQCQCQKISKVVACGNVIYGLDQENFTLYSATIATDNLSSENPTSFKEHEVEFNTTDVDKKPKVVDISASALECFAIDCEGGIYKVPNLLWRMERVNFRHIHSGFGFHLLLTDTGAVYSWGNSSRGELGQRTVTANVDSTCESPPCRIEFFDDLPSVVVSLACGGWHSLALTSDGDIYSWGWNESGQLGHTVDKLSPITSDPYPVDLGSRDDPVVNIVAGARHSVAVLKSGKIFTWGFNKFGGLALGDYENRFVPSQVVLPFQSNDCNFVKVKCGRWITLLLLPT